MQSGPGFEQRAGKLAPDVVDMQINGAICCLRLRRQLAPFPYRRMSVGSENRILPLASYVRHLLADFISQHKRTRRVLLPVRGVPPHLQLRAQPRPDWDYASLSRVSLPRRQDNPSGVCLLGASDNVALDLVTSFDVFEQPPLEFSGRARWEDASPKQHEYEIQWDVVPSWDDLMDIARQLKQAADDTAAYTAEREKETEQAGQAFLKDPSARATSLAKDHVLTVSIGSTGITRLE